MRDVCAANSRNLPFLCHFPEQMSNNHEHYGVIPVWTDEHRSYPSSITFLKQLTWQKSDRISRVIRIRGCRRASSRAVLLNGVSRVKSPVLVESARESRDSVMGRAERGVEVGLRIEDGTRRLGLLVVTDNLRDKKNSTNICEIHLNDKPGSGFKTVNPTIRKGKRGRNGGNGSL